MKRCISVLLTMLMVVGIALPALAQEEGARPSTSKLALYLTTGESGAFDVSLGSGAARATGVSIASSDSSIATASPGSLTEDGTVAVSTFGQGTAYIVMTFTYPDGSTSDRELRVMSIDSDRYADLGYSKLTPQEAVDAAYARRNPDNARYIVTTDNETDDMNSMIRLLLYANDIDIAGIVYSSSTHHWRGDGENLYQTGGATSEMYQYRWMGSAAHQVFIEEYRKVLPNLLEHDDRYPSADYLRDMVFEGNILYTSDMTGDTPGSDLIKYTLLDERDDSPVWLSAWGGMNTIAMALKSIEDEFKDDPDWENIKARVSEKARIYSIGTQDNTTASYIQPNWPEIMFVMNGSFGNVAFGAAASSNTPSTVRPYLQPDFHKQYIVGTSPYMIHYQTYNDGLNLTNLSYDPNTAAEGADPNGHIEPPMGWGNRFITGNTSHSNLSRQGLNSARPDQANATGEWVEAPWDEGARIHRLIDPDDPRWMEWGEPQHEDFGNPKVPTYWGGSKPAAFSFYSEGDSPSYFGLINNGLRSDEHPSYGGWGHRFVQSSSAATPNQWTASGAADDVPDGVHDGTVSSGMRNWFPTHRWLPAMQNDFAARIAWTVNSYEDANHAPVVEVEGDLDRFAMPGDTITLTGIATDPDGDTLTLEWWQYREAGSYDGEIDIKGADTLTAEFVVPDDAHMGDTIHVIFEVIDDAEIPLTKYQRVVVTIGEDEAEDSIVKLSTDAHNVKKGETFKLETTFAEEQESNTAILNYTWNGDLFKFAYFYKADGVTLVDHQYGDGWAKITLMAPDYDLESLGTLDLTARDDAPLVRGWESVKLDIEYVLRDENGDKSIENATTSARFTTVGNGPNPEPYLPGDTNDDGVVDIMDLSNMIDWFGYTSENQSDWDDWYTYFDFNNDGEIDISDIAHVARLI